MSAPRPLQLSPRQRQDMRLRASRLDLINDLSCSGVPFSEGGVGRDVLPAVNHAVRVGPSHDSSDVIQVVPVDEIAPIRANKFGHPIPLNHHYVCGHETACTRFPSRLTAQRPRELARRSASVARELGASYASRQTSHFAFSPKHQNAKLAAPISSASTGAASNLSRESAVQFGIHLGVQPCEEAYPAARIRQCGKLKQGTADGSRTPLIAEATGRRAAVNRPPVRSAQVSPAPTPSTGRAA